ncbi:MAG: hypothetical protein ACRDA3_02825 [Peptostreptococcaceae bacterium]
MKYKIKRGSVGRALIPYRFKRPENVITIRYKKARETKYLKQIMKLLYEGRDYEQISDELEITVVEVLNIIQQNTLRYGSGMTKVNIIDMLSKGATTYDVAKFYKCEESKIIAIKNDINLMNRPNIEMEINLAINVKNLLNKNLKFNSISKRLNRNRYFLFRLYNKYFNKYNNEIIDVKVVEKLAELDLTSEEIANFYQIKTENILEIRLLISQVNKHKIISKSINHKDNKKDESILDKAYENSNRQDFYDFKMKNR